MKKLLICTFLFSLFIPCLFAEEKYEKVFLNAQKLQAAECYKEAALEYKRYLFCADYAPLEHEDQAFIELSRYYHKTGDYTTAINYIKSAINIIKEKNPSSADLEELYLEHIILLANKSTKDQDWLERDPSILGYINFPVYSQKVKKLAYISLIKSNLENWEWERAQKEFTDFTTLYPDLYTLEEIQKFNKLIEEQKNAKEKNPKLALYLSIIPGLGQTYAGNPKDGLNAFILNASLIAASTYSLITQNYADFILVEIELLIRFYKGNLANAEQEAVKYNLEQNEKYAHKMMEIVENSEKEDKKSDK